MKALVSEGCRVECYFYSDMLCVGIYLSDRNGLAFLFFLGLFLLSREDMRGKSRNVRVE